MTKQSPSKESYENALKVVEQYEKRQHELHYLEKELAYKLEEFSQVKFKIDKKSGEVFFSGLHLSDTLLMGKSKCSQNDKFEIVIGKLIAVKNALHEDVSDVVKLVEPKHFTGGILKGGNGNPIALKLSSDNVFTFSK